MASKGYRKYIRREKARIRREVEDQPERDKMIADLYSGVEDKKTPEPKNQKA